MSSPRRHRVAVAVPIAAELVDRLSRHAALDVAWEPDLLPPRRHAGDYAGDPAFRRSPQEQSRYEQLVDGAEILFGIPDTSPAALARAVRANPRLAWLHTMAAGGGSQVRDAGLDAHRLRTLRVSTSAGVHGHALAEFALLGLLAGLKDLPRWERDRRERAWPERAPVRQLRDATVLVLGSGGIGGAVADLLGALGAQGWARVRDEASTVSPAVARRITQDELRDALPDVDAVVAALPDTPRTRHLVDAEFLARLRPGAILVNVGRGTVVDEAALVAALDERRVGFAALDVFEVEPLPATSPLWHHERVLMSPHTAALDAGEERRIVELFLDNVDRYIGGQELINEMDPVEFY